MVGSSAYAILFKKMYADWKSVHTYGPSGFQWCFPPNRADLEYPCFSKQSLVYCSCVFNHKTEAPAGHRPCGTPLCQVLVEARHGRGECDHGEDPRRVGQKTAYKRAAGETVDVGESLVCYMFLVYGFSVGALLMLVVGGPCRDVSMPLLLARSQEDNHSLPLSPCRRSASVCC